MVHEASSHRPPKLQLQRETLRNLARLDPSGGAQLLTSACKSGWTCCNATCAAF